MSCLPQMPIKASSVYDWELAMAAGAAAEQARAAAAAAAARAPPNRVNNSDRVALPPVPGLNRAMQVCGGPSTPVSHRPLERIADLRVISVAFTPMFVGVLSFQERRLRLGDQVKHLWSQARLDAAAAADDGKQGGAQQTASRPSLAGFLNSVKDVTTKVKTSIAASATVCSIPNVQDSSVMPHAT